MTLLPAGTRGAIMFALVLGTTLSLVQGASAQVSPTTARFEYGLTTRYGSMTPVPSFGAGSDAVAIDGSSITGLTCNTECHVRATATNSNGTANGRDATVSTAAGNTPPTLVLAFADIAAGTDEATLGPFEFSIGDDTGTAGLVVSGSSSDQALVPDASIVFSGSGASRFLEFSTGSTGGTATITVTVTDPDGEQTSVTRLVHVRPTLWIDPIGFVIEEDSGTAALSVNVTLSATSTDDVTVVYYTAQDSTAISGVDFTAASGTLTFPAGTTVQTIDVLVAGDRIPEIHESFLVLLETGTEVNATVADSVALAFIVDTDGTLDRRPTLVSWMMPLDVEIDAPGHLRKTAGSGWNAGAASGAALLGGDGWMEFTAAETNTTLMAGLSRGNTNTDFSDIDFAVYLDNNGVVYVLESGAVRGSFGAYAIDDRFAVAVENGVVVYRKNGVLFYTSSVAPAYPLLVDTALFTPGATVEEVVLSGWLARDVMWTNNSGMSDFESSLEKWEATGWNAGSASTRGLLSGDGFVEFTATETTTTRMLGLSNDNAGFDYSDIDFGLYLHDNGTLYVVEGGVTQNGRVPVGSYVTGDRLRVAVEAGQVVYRRNGLLLHTSAVAPTYPLLADTAFFTTGATLADAVMAGTFATEVTFASGVNADQCGCYYSLAKHGDVPDGWNAGAVSMQTLVAGDGFVEFMADGVAEFKIAGLSHGNTNEDYADVDFGILLADNFSVHVYEGGAYQGVFGVYWPGDRFRVSVEGGVVRYRRNGVLFYTSLVAPTYPLLLDTAFYTPTATWLDVLFAGDSGQPVAWASTAGITVDDNALIKTDAAGWNAGPISTRALVAGDGFVAFTPNEETSHVILGLSRGNTSTNYTDIDFGILLTAEGGIYVYESGASRGWFGAYVAGDRFQVGIESGIVRYLKNGIALYTSAVAPTYPLLVDTALFTSGATILDVVLAGNLGEAVTWTSATGVSASGSQVTKTRAAGWNAGAVSTRAIASGDGFASFTTNETTTHKVLGLSQGNASTDYTDIDFGILLSAQGGMYVYESGTSRGAFGPYAAGDRFQVGIEGGVVRYMKNGTVFYTSGVAPGYPLLVDTALFSPGATLVDVVMACGSAACQ